MQKKPRDVVVVRVSEQGDRDERFTKSECGPDKSRDKDHDHDVQYDRTKHWVMVSLEKSWNGLTTQPRH